MGKENIPPGHVPKAVTPQKEGEDDDKYQGDSERSPEKKPAMPFLPFQHSELFDLNSFAAVQVNESKICFHEFTLEKLLDPISTPNLLAKRITQSYGPDLFHALKNGKHDDLNNYLGRLSIPIATSRIAFLAEQELLVLHEDIDPPMSRIRNGKDAVVAHIDYVPRHCRCRRPRVWLMRYCRSAGCEIKCFHEGCLSKDEKGRLKEAGKEARLICDECVKREKIGLKGWSTRKGKGVFSFR
jgi:hypothetical protein